MGREILYTKAKDKNGNLIDISNAEKGVDYYCPGCSKVFIFKKSGKTGRYSKRPHFAHPKGSSPDCTPKSVLHSLFQELLIDILEKYKVEKKPFVFNWHCASCGYKNSGNLLEKVTLIRGEYFLGECRPDMALLDNEGNVLVAIELVYTHKPEENVLQYYKDNKIALIQIDLISDEDLNRVEEKVKNPNIVDLCFSPKCQNYDRDKIKREVQVTGHKCGRCPAVIPKFHIEIDSIFGRQSSCDFTEDEFDSAKSWAESRRYSIERGRGPNAKGNYPVVVCENCKIMRSKYNRRRPL